MNNLENIIKDSSDSAFINDVIEASNDCPILVDFWAPWCGPCKKITPFIEDQFYKTPESVTCVNIDIDGNTYDVLDLGSLKDKFNAFGWTVLEEKEGNNIEKIIHVLNNAKSFIGKGKPIIIILHTEMGNGVDYMMGTHKWHGVAPNDEQLEIALQQNPETLGDY